MKAQDKINELTDQIARLKNEQRICCHVWGDTVADHIYHPGYTDPGDPVGTMGVDWRGPCHIPSRTDHQWKRTCKKCGLVQTTTHAETKPTGYTTTPIF